MPKSTTSTEVRAAITAANQEFVAAFGRGDAAGIATLYTKDSQVFPPNNNLVAGRQAIQTFWQSAMSMGITGAKLETVDVEDYGDTAGEVGKYTLQGEGGKVVDVGKYVVIWKRESGQWKLHRDIWNSNIPAPKPSESD
jgi:ketosteroid isomerase-like protein